MGRFHFGISYLINQKSCIHPALQSRVETAFIHKHKKLLNSHDNFYEQQELKLLFSCFTPFLRWNGCVAIIHTCMVCGVSSFLFCLGFSPPHFLFFLFPFYVRLLSPLGIQSCIYFQGQLTRMENAKLTSVFSVCFTTIFNNERELL